MNKAIIFGAGLLIGAAVGTTLTVFAYQKEKEKWLNEDKNNTKKDTHDNDAIETTPEELRDYYIDQLRNLGFEVQEAEIDDEYYEEDYIPEEGTRTPSSVNPLPEDEEDSDNKESPIEPNPEPYEIPEREFGNKEFYDYETIHYYQKDHVMTDANYEFIDNWKQHIGDIERQLDGEAADSIYIRNEVECTDYEVLIFPDSYAHAVEGEDEPLGDMAD